MREKLLEQGGSEYYVTPLVLDLKENIYFSFREICVAPVPLFHVVVLLLFLFFFYSHLCLASTHIKQQNTSKHT